MASMTRGRARNVELASTELHVEYHRQRAAADLILAEGNWISPRAIRFINAPRLFTERQVEGWRAVTTAVHSESGAIYAQLAHSAAVPHPDFFDGEFGSTDKTIETYDYLVGRLNGLSLSYLHVGKALNDLSGTPIAALQDTIGYYRARFKDTLIPNFGFDRASAHTAIESKRADLVSFAKPFICNPDLVRRFREDLPLADPSPETHYQGGLQGYVNYPAASRGDDPHPEGNTTHQSTTASWSTNQKGIQLWK